MSSESKRRYSFQECQQIYKGIWNKNGDEVIKVLRPGKVKKLKSVPLSG